MMKKFKTAPLLKADLVITGRVIFILFDIDMTISRIEMITTVLNPVGSLSSNYLARIYAS